MDVADGWVAPVAPFACSRGAATAEGGAALGQSARLNGQDPWAFLKGVVQRLATHANRRIDELRPHRWDAGEMIELSARPSSVLLTFRTHSAISGGSLSPKA